MLTKILVVPPFGDSRPLPTDWAASPRVTLTITLNPVPLSGSIVVPRLPQEIVEETIDMLVGDTEGLLVFPRLDQLNPDRSRRHLHTCIPCLAGHGSFRRTFVRSLLRSLLGNLTSVRIERSTVN
jgi:hypothetical protein